MTTSQNRTGAFTLGKCTITSISRSEWKRRIDSAVKHWHFEKRGKGHVPVPDSGGDQPTSHSSSPAAAPDAIVYSYRVNVPSRTFPSIKRKKLAINDIGDEQDGFTRLNFELQDGDIIQVVRQPRAGGRD